MKLLIGSLLCLAAIGCGGSERDSRSIIPNQGPSSSDRVVTDQSESGLARWTLVATDCAGMERGSFETNATVRVEDGTLTVGLPTMPELTGPVVENQAAISGVAKFQGSKETITCSVAGTASVESNLVIAQVSETLTSASELNCKQNWKIELSY